MTAVPMKKYGYPTVSTTMPEYPASSFGNKSIIELKIAYCVAVKVELVNPAK